MCKSNCVSSVVLFLGIICAVQQDGAQVQSPGSNPLSPEEVNQLQAKAQAGDPIAQLKIGRAYEDGNGVPQSDNQAVKWYRAAAEQGNATAQNDVGLMFRLGRGVEQDKVEAVKWYRKAARQENPNALFNLGTAYYNGDGVSIDDVWAYAWFLLAQNFGSQTANDAVKRMKEGAAGPSQSAAFERIGDMYQKGDDLPQSSSKAVDWYRKAAENGEGRTQMKLVSLLLQGQSATSNYAEARRLCEKAASLKFSPGAYCVGQMYEQGLGVERDISKAAKWFGEAANMGLAVAAFRVGEMYWKGEGLQQDRISAYEFIYLASTSDLPEARQEKERLEKELTRKELEKGKAKAVEWTRQHQPLVLKGKPLTVN
jgi:TPR repeat protein